MTVRYVVIRSGGGEEMKLTGETVPRWESIGSALFYSMKEAREFAGKLDNANVFRLIRVPDIPPSDSA
jgi:hypothetical protein